MDNSATQEEMGYVVPYPAKAYYPAATPYNQNAFEGAGQLIKLTANTHHGYEFVRWTGEGDVYKGNGDKDTDVSLEATDEDTEHWVKNPTIYIKMAKESNGQWEPTDRTVTAVFRNSRRALVVEGGQRDEKDLPWEPTIAGACLTSLRYCVRTLDRPNYEDLKASILEHNVFAFNGHGGTDGIEVNKPNCIQDGTDWRNVRDFHPGWRQGIYSFSYKLVYLNSCYSGTSVDGWVQAFQADAFVGFSTRVWNFQAPKFDQQFWVNMGKGMSSKEAAKDAVSQFYTYMLTSFPNLVTRGSVFLNDCDN